MDLALLTLNLSRLVYTFKYSAIMLMRVIIMVMRVVMIR